MFTAKIVSVAKLNGSANFVIEYSKGAESFKENFSICSSEYTIEKLKAYIQSRCNDFDASYEFADSVEKDVAIDTTPAPLSEEEKKRTEYIDDLRKMRGMKALIDCGAKEETDDDYVEVVARVKEKYKPEYVGL